MNGLDHQVHKKREKKRIFKVREGYFCFLFAVSVFRPNLAAGHIHGVCRKERKLLCLLGQFANYCTNDNSSHTRGRPQTHTQEKT